MALRTDAAKNRQDILRAAHDAFAESGDASLNMIAKRAGVGPGTLYRHFPTREALILAVYQHDMKRLVDSVPEVLVNKAPLDAFRMWFHTLADYVRVKHGLGEALHSAAVQNAINETYKPVVTAVAQLIDACVADGSMRTGLDADEVLLLMGFMWRVDAGPSGKKQGARLMEMVIEGVRPR